MSCLSSKPLEYNKEVLIDWCNLGNLYYRIFTSKYPCNAEDVEIVKKMKDTYLQYLRVLDDLSGKTVGLSMRRNGVCDLVKRKIKNCNSFIYLFQSRNGLFIPYSVFSDNDVEGIFRDIRLEEGKNNQSPDCEGCLNRLPFVLLKQQDINVTRATRSGSYSFCESSSSNHILLNAENLEKFKNLKKKDDQDFEDFVDRLCDDVSLNKPSNEDEKKNENLLTGFKLERFKYIVGYYVKSTKNKCRSTRRGALAKLMSCLVENTKFRNIYAPRNEMVRFCWKLDLAMRMNLSKVMTSGAFVAIEEILNRRLKDWYFQCFQSEVWNMLVGEESKGDYVSCKKVFDVLVETILRVRVNEVLRNMGMLPVKGSRSFRGALK